MPQPRGFAIQARINMESMGADGIAKPSGGTLDAHSRCRRVRACASIPLAMPATPPIRSFDSLLAKLIAHSPSADFADAVAKAYRALCEFRIEGVRPTSDFCKAC